MPDTRHIRHSMPILGDAEVAAAERVLRSGHVAQGREVEAFEESCAEFTGYDYGVAVSSGTVALELAIRAAALDDDAEVAVPSYACTAVLHAVSHAGARPALIDIDDSLNLDLARVPESSRLTIQTHTFGHPARSNPEAPTIDDLAQALGAERSLPAPVAVASFYATKLITSGGEGGMLLTSDAAVAEFARDRRDYDNRNRLALRFNYKMTDLAAAIGSEQLQRLPGWVETRREIAGQYSEALKDVPLQLPSGEGHIFFRYAVRTGRRDALEQHLHARGIEAKRPVYKPLHLYYPDAAKTVPASLAPEYPASDSAHREILSIPLHPGLTAADINHVVDSIKLFFEI